PAVANRVSTMNLDRASGYSPGASDPRPLAVQVFEMRAVDPGRAWTGPVAQQWQREAQQVELVGAYGGEVFGEAGEGVWLAPRALLRVPAGAGVLSLRLWAPRPTPPLTRLRVGNEQVVGPLDIAEQPMEVSIEIAVADSTDGRVEIEIASVPYLPAVAGAGDSRELGVVLSRLTFVPAPVGLD
ncbi:MAG: hypothetical protein MUP13_11610, partial [Thermoanaerobaculales bacterium]|nr:hypothetical protein [Thermoanaerobaculales bacterium]